MASIYVKFETTYEDSNYKFYSFDIETTIESMLLNFLNTTNSKITLDPDEIAFFYLERFLNQKNNDFLKKKIKDVLRIQKNICKIRVIDIANIMKCPPIADTFINFGDYKTYFISLHQKLSEFFDEKYSNLNYDRTYKQNFINFIKSMDIDGKNSIIPWVNNINSGTAQEFIQAYTGETPLCYSLNKWLRECKRDDFEKIKYFAGPFSYSLYKYAHDNSKMKVNYSKKFYRKMVISLMDYESYKNNIGKLICYPAFTSVSEKDMTKYNFPTQLAKGINNIKSDDISVILYIDYKCKNSSYPTPCINVSYDSANSGEKEYIFPPFSFFKIDKVENRSGTSDNPHIIYMTVPNKRILVEFAIKNNKKIFYDENLNEIYSLENEHLFQLGNSFKSNFSLGRIW